jgi:DNA helicase II / ATP-dependent DNA helicase PcrA
MGASYLESLNPAQRRAVEHGGASGPLLIIAGAGSGKTNTLAHRVAHLAAAGADPRRILLLTFSRRAASEMIRRVERILHSTLPAGHRARSTAITWSGTFHAVGARLLRHHAAEIGLSPTFTIHDREDAADLINLVRHDLGFSEKQSRFPLKSTCLSIYSLIVNSQLPIADVLTKSFPWCLEWEAELRELFAAYVESKQRQNVLDYDDLLLYWAEMMGVAELAETVSSYFDHVLVDEYQDTNRLQAAILMRLRPDGQGVTVVGDDAQSIYSFRAASVRNILDFPTQFTPPAALVTLEQNYRSTQPILAASNAVIGLAAERFTKNLFSDRVSDQKPRLVTVADEIGQVDYVAQMVLSTREGGVPLKSQAVLFRTGHHSAGLEIELSRRNIPFVKFGGLRFLEASHVKDVLSVLRWCENTSDRISGFRTLQILPGIGPVTAGRILDGLGSANDASLALSQFSLPSGVSRDWKAFLSLYDSLRYNKTEWPAEIHAVRQWYEPHLTRTHADAHIRLGDLVQLEQIAGSYGSRERFLTELTLDPPNSTSDESGVPLLDEDYLILSTIHSAKGQEWSSVYILNVVDGCIPSDMATGTSNEIEEERRLLYVAMTRAKDELHLVVPQRFYAHQQARHGERHMYASRTRFIPAGLLGHFQRGTWPLAERVADGPKRASVRVDVQSRMRNMWR